MTKKMITLAALMLLALGLQAQSLNGNWSMAQEWMTKLNKEMDDSSATIDRFGMSFTDKEAKVVMMMSMESDGMKMKIGVGVPGTYKRNGNNVKCNFDAKKVEINILDLQSDDEEVKGMLANPTTRESLLKLINSMMEEELKKDGNDLLELADPFEEFNIKSLTSSKLEIGVEDEKDSIPFDRVKEL